MCTSIFPLTLYLLLRHTGVELEKRRQHSATLIQAAWRGHEARQLATQLRQQRAEEEEARRQEARRAAATLIQVWVARCRKL